jgi:hypothetical protein
VVRLSFARTPSWAESLTILPWAWILPGSMLRLLVALLLTLRSAVRSRRDLVFENLALRQQLATLASRRHPEVRPADRAFWILLRLSWSQWAEMALIRLGGHQRSEGYAFAIAAADRLIARGR